MNSEAPFALRLSSQLLFGIVRIYQRKVRYLLQDCNDALGKLRQVSAFNSQFFWVRILTFFSRSSYFKRFLFSSSHFDVLVFRVRVLTFLYFEFVFWCSYISSSCFGVLFFEFVFRRLFGLPYLESESVILLKVFHSHRSSLILKNSLISCSFPSSNFQLHQGTPLN